MPLAPDLASLGEALGRRTWWTKMSLSRPLASLSPSLFCPASCGLGEVAVYSFVLLPGFLPAGWRCSCLLPLPFSQPPGTHQKSLDPRNERFSVRGAVGAEERVSVPAPSPSPLLNAARTSTHNGLQGTWDTQAGVGPRPSARSVGPRPGQDQVQIRTGLCDINWIEYCYACGI